MFDRFQVCLGYYWFQAYGYADYREACHIWKRLQKIGFKPSFSDEYSEAMNFQQNQIAKKVYDNLLEKGYSR